MDKNSLSHTTWECKYHLGATCGRCLKCAQEEPRGRFSVPI